MMKVVSGSNGIVVAQGISHVRKKLPEIIEDGSNELSLLSRQLFNGQFEELKTLDEKVATYDKRIETLASSHNVCKRLMKLEGVPREHAFYDFQLTV